jgi:hypothetical protein
MINVVAARPPCASPLPALLPIMPPLSFHLAFSHDGPAIPPLPFARQAVTAGGPREEEVAVEGRPPEATAPWFPTDHLFGAVSGGTRTRALLAAVDGQARLVDDLLAACAAGAATLPPALLDAVREAATSLAAAQRGAEA